MWPVLINTIRSEAQEKFFEKVGKMRVFVDILTGVELFSDAFKFELVGNKAMYKVKSKWGVKTFEGEKVEDHGATDPNSVVSNEIVDKFGFQKASYKKKEFINHLKIYFEKIKGGLRKKNNNEELINFSKHGQLFVKKITSEFHKWETYTTDAKDKGMIVLQKFGDDQITPYFYFWKHGTKSVEY